MAQISLLESEKVAYEKVVNENLTIGVIEDPPYAYPCFFDNPTECTNPGIGIEITQNICEIMNLQCSFVPANHTEYGHNYAQDGWHGMIKEILDGKYETSLPAFKPTTERIKVLEFSTTFFHQQSYLITDQPDMVHFKDGAVLLAFSWRVWALVLVTVVMLGLLMAWFQRSKKGLSFGMSCVSKSVDVVAVLTSQDPKYEKEKYPNATYVLFGVWGMACIVLAGMYSSQIVATALDSNPLLPFHDISSLAKCVRNRKCTLLARTPSNAYVEEIYLSKDPQIQELRQAIRGNPIQLMDSTSNSSMTEIAHEKDITHPVVYGSSSTFASLIRAQKACSLGSLLHRSYDPAAFPFRPKSPYIPLFNRAIQVLREFGMTNRFYDKYVGSVLAEQRKCSMKNTHAEPMSVAAFLGAFFLIGTGWLVAMSTVFLEKIVKRYVKSPQANVKTDRKQGTFTVDDPCMTSRRHSEPNRMQFLNNVVFTPLEPPSNYNPHKENSLQM